MSVHGAQPALNAARMGGVSSRIVKAHLPLSTVCRLTSGLSRAILRRRLRRPVRPQLSSNPVDERVVDEVPVDNILRKPNSTDTGPSANRNFQKLDKLGIGI